MIGRTNDTCAVRFSIFQRRYGKNIHAVSIFISGVTYPIDNAFANGFFAPVSNNFIADFHEIFRPFFCFS